MTEQQLDQLLDTIQQKHIALPESQIGSARGRIKSGIKDVQRQARIDECLRMIAVAKDSGEPSDVIELGTLIEELEKRVKKLGGVK